MDKFESVFNLVRELVEDFKRNETEYLSHTYQEAEVRRDYIDKFFIETCRLCFLYFS